MKKTGEFFSDVFEVAKLIPYGRVTSYGAIAKYLGLKSGARMVGWAMNASHSMSDIPAHRVVNSRGLLTGKYHFADHEEMQRLLEAEGLKIENDQVVDFKTFFWDPSENLI